MRVSAWAVERRVAVSRDSAVPVERLRRTKLLARLALSDIVPVQDVHFSAEEEEQVPVEFQGAAIGQIAQRKGTINASEGDDGDAQFVTIGADVPLDNMFGYSADLRGATQGKGEYAMEYLKHSPVLRDKQDEIIKRHAEALAAKRKAGD